MLAMLMSSCSTIYKMTTRPVYISAEGSMNEEWVGRNYSDIVMQFGAPTRSADDGRDGKIHVYEDIRTIVSTSTSHNEVMHSVDTETSERTVRDFTEFYVDPSGECYLVRSNRKVEDGRKFSLYNTILTSGLCAGAVIALFALLGC